MDKKQELRRAQVPEFSASLFAWPALMAASVGEAFAASLARRPAEFEPAQKPRPAWTTPHRVRLELGTMALRDFSCGDRGTPTLICAPYALHTATIADFAARPQRRRGAARRRHRAPLRDRLALGRTRHAVPVDRQLSCRAQRRGRRARARRSISSGFARAAGWRSSMRRVFPARCGAWCSPARRSTSRRGSRSSRR